MAADHYREVRSHLPLCSNNEMKVWSWSIDSDLNTNVFMKETEGFSTMNCGYILHCSSAAGIAQIIIVSLCKRFMETDRTCGLPD